MELESITTSENKMVFISWEYWSKMAAVAEMRNFSSYHISLSDCLSCFCCWWCGRLAIPASWWSYKGRWPWPVAVAVQCSQLSLLHLSAQYTRRWSWFESANCRYCCHIWQWLESSPGRLPSHSKANLYSFIVWYWRCVFTPVQVSLSTGCYFLCEYCIWLKRW